MRKNLKFVKSVGERESECGKKFFGRSIEIYNTNKYMKNKRENKNKYFRLPTLYNKFFSFVLLLKLNIFKKYYM